jgi:hypothetical protein
LEDARKPRRRLEQIGPMAGLRIGFGSGRIAERFQYRPGTGIPDAFRAVAEQQGSGSREHIRHAVFRPVHGGLTPVPENRDQVDRPGPAPEENMLAKAFVVAMAADIARSDYGKPSLIRSRSREWLIACRWGRDGEYISIATAGVMTDSHALAAPDAIAPIHSLFGVLVSESDTDAASTFLLVRQLPAPIELAGIFFPADGFVRLQQRDTLRLVCETRYSHSCGWLDGKEVRKDIPDPAPSSTEAMAWHIEARRCNWIGEFIAAPLLRERRAIYAAG